MSRPVATPLLLGASALGMLILAAAASLPRAQPTARTLGALAKVSHYNLQAQRLPAGLRILNAGVASGTMAAP